PVVPPLPPPPPFPYTTLFRSPRFAGGHPLAGTHAHGFAAARVDLFKGAIVYITATRNGEGAASEVSHFWESVLEAHPVRIDAAQDRKSTRLNSSHLGISYAVF